MTDSNNPRIIKCPTCGGRVPWVEDEVHRPFCSRKCQLIDFGEWAAERNRIPAEEADLFSESDTGDPTPQDDY